MKKIIVLIMLSIFSLGSIHAEITWNLLSNGTLTISGTDMPNYECWWDDYEHTRYPPWYSQRDKIKKVVIEMGVTNIGSFAFRECSELNSITIPESVTTIGIHAFAGCSSLTSITIPNSVTGSLGSGTFAGCRSLTSIIIPNSVTSIENNSLYWPCGCFAGCHCLESVTIGNSVTCIGESSFEECFRLTSITIPNSVTSIGVSAFKGCSGLNSITIPESVTSIGYDAFDGTEWYYNQPDGLVYAGHCLYNYAGTMPANTKIEIKEGTKVIADRAFYDCKDLISVTIPNSITSIGEYAFYGCTGITSITIPNSVTSIGKDAFYECTGITSITIPNSVTSIGDDAFYGCTSITSIAISNSVTSIGGGAFSDCTGIASVTIPNSVTSIGGWAFYGCQGLKKVTIEVNRELNIQRSVFYESGLEELIMIGETLPKYTDEDFASGLYKNITLYVPSSLYRKYRSTFPWSRFSNIVGIPDESINLTDMEIFAVIAKISTIGKVEYTDVCKGKIDDASTAYDALREDQKALVSNLDVLTTAKQTYDNLRAAAEKLEADKAKANTVVAKINAIGKVEYTNACKGKIDDANKAYEALTEDQKALVTNLDVLTTAKQTYDNLKAAAEKLVADKAKADAVIAKIVAIGNVEYTDACKDKIDDASMAYNTLTEDQKALVSNLDVLTTAKQTYETLKAAAEKLAADKARADAVVAKIAAIGNVEYTDACKSKIDAASKAYETLTADQKALVTNLNVLTTAKQTYDNLKAAADKLAIDKAAADPVVAKIDAIGKVEYTYACKDKIDEANNAYNALTADQKALVTNLDVLTTAKQTYDSLKAAADKLAADKAAFDKYKSEIIAIIESLVKEDDSDAVKEIINKAISEIDALEYEEVISLDDNKAKINSFAASVNEAVENQRAEDQKTNGIEELEFAEKVNIYDLNGRKITNSMLKSGLYIKNGKKVVVK